MYYLNDIATFARKKGSKDKTKRQTRSGQFFDGKINTTTGKRNVTLREPVIKRAIGGAVVGGVLGVGLSSASVALSVQRSGKPLSNNTKILAAKYIGSNALGVGLTGATIGAGLGVGKYLQRRREIQRYNAGKHTVNKYEITKR